MPAKEKPRDKERARRKQRVSRLEYRKNGRGEREKERGERKREERERERKEKERGERKREEREERRETLFLGSYKQPTTHNQQRFLVGAQLDDSSSFFPSCRTPIRHLRPWKEQKTFILARL
ncbi:MAG TPA: hypothetical protein PLA66_07435 [Mesotoga sp.]|nr:hypothetical protein [Mesotoga sp.]